MALETTWCTIGDNLFSALYSSRGQACGKEISNQGRYISSWWRGGKMSGSE